MFLTPEEINEIRRQIVEGVEAAQRGGIVCDYPDSFTVTKQVGPNPVSVTYPIWTKKHQKIECV